MGKTADRAKRFLYRNLTLEGYLRAVSRLFFAGYGLGVARNSPAYEYPRFLKQIVRRGDTAIDIGANLGYYSRIISQLAGPRGRVYAVEPVPPILEVLKHNLRRCRNVEIIPCALGAENREIRMGNDSVRQAGYMGTGRNFVMDGPQTEAGIEFTARMRRGSEIFGSLDRLDFIKCDIEGYESVVIPQMMDVIVKFLPVVMIETAGPERAAMKEIFRQLGYTGFVLSKGRPERAAGNDTKDLIFVPQHRLADFKKLIRQ